MLYGLYRSSSKLLRPPPWRGLYQYTSVLSTEVFPITLRKASEAVSEGNDLVPQKEELGSGQPTMEDVYRRMKLIMSHFEETMDSYSDRLGKKMDEKFDEVKKMDQHLTRLEHGARQPRLAKEADGQADTRTRERTEGAATAVQAIRGDCFSAHRVEPDPTTNSTSFGMKAEPPALPCRDDSVVECGAASFKSCLPSMEMRPSTAAGGLVPTGDASKASETTLNEPPLRFCLTEETDLKAKNSWTSVPSASYDSSSVFKGRNLFATPYCRRVVDTKSRQNRTFDPGGSRGHLAPAHVWDRGALWFVERFDGLGQLKQSCSVFVRDRSRVPKKVRIWLSCFSRKRYKCERNELPISEVHQFLQGA